MRRQKKFSSTMRSCNVSPKKQHCFRSYGEGNNDHVAGTFHENLSSEDFCRKTGPQCNQSCFQIKEASEYNSISRGQSKLRQT
mmetsp:Transcript_10954/g.18319  ORF Transcript_10954/g.18319 Transcript_10954/m.18319 type:complete len:83 (+) Transcript_10954:205-453(+)